MTQKQKMKNEKSKQNKIFSKLENVKKRVKIPILTVRQLLKFILYKKGKNLFLKNI